ncbi:hypothetical protein [Streptomyces lavendulocolor]|uniref:hypothetical protein n=1 Tax=Streptomyces lavendulocolor TaxID=67316 RepID=UPI00340A249F
MNYRGEDNNAPTVGYQDPGTFAALFARHTGHRPHAYRTAFRRTAGTAGTAGTVEPVTATRQVTARQGGVAGRRTGGG